MNHLVRTLTPENYDTACDLAGAALLRRVPAAATILQIAEDRAWGEFSVAVYIAADFENVVRYVGSTVRAGPVGDRTQEHVLAGACRKVDPLDGSSPDRGHRGLLARRIEGRVGAVLRPLDTIRLPALGKSWRTARRRAPR